MTTSPQAASNGMHGEFAVITSQIVDYDEVGHPKVNDHAQGQAVDLAHQIGATDGGRPGIDEHTTKKVLPNQEFVANALEPAMSHLGTEVDKKLVDSRAGRVLTQKAPPRKLTTWQAILAWLKKYSFTLIAIVVVGIVEYVVGTEWTQRVFDLSDDTAHVVALAMPVIFALVGFAIAHAVMISMETRAPRVIKASAVVLLLGTITTVVCAGLVISETVGGGTSGGGGVSGGVGGGTTDDSSDTAYQLVKFGVYVALLVTVMILVLVLHLMDLWREKQAHVHDAAMAAHHAPTSSQIAAGNLAYLSSFLDLIDTLAKVRTNVVTAYVAGVKGSLSPRIADTWEYGALLEDPADPVWVAELQDEIERLKKEAGVSQPAG